MGLGSFLLGFHADVKKGARIFHLLHQRSPGQIGGWLRASVVPSFLRFRWTGLAMVARFVGAYLDQDGVDMTLSLAARRTTLMGLRSLEIASLFMDRHFH